MKSQKWIRLVSRIVAADPSVGIANAALLLRVHVPAGSAYGGASQAIGRRWSLLARAFGPASCVPLVNAALGT